MNLYDIVAPMTMDEAKATKQRLDAKCWRGKHKEGTKVKGGVRVNNCVPNESVKEDNFHGSQDDWHAGDNAWSSENHEMVESHSFSNGDQVELKPEYADRAGEVYTVSQCDPERGRCWIGDEDGRGWYANFNQLVPSVGQEELDEFAPSPERDDSDEVPDQILMLANRWWNATDDQPKITNVLRSLGWSISQVESEDDAVQMQHDDGTTYFISADDFDPEVFEHIGKVKDGYRLYSSKGKNLGTFPSKAGAEKHEREVQYFKHAKEGVAEEFKGNVKDTELKNVDPANHSQGEGEFVKNQLHSMKRVITHLDNAIGRGENLPDWVQSEIAQAADKIIGAMNYSISSKEQDIEQQTGNDALMKEQGVAEMDKSQKGPAGWNLDDYDYGKGKWTQGKIVKAKDAVKDMHKELDSAFNKVEPKSKKPVKESYWTKLQNERNTKLNTLVNELKESIKK